MTRSHRGDAIVHSGGATSALQPSCERSSLTTRTANFSFSLTFALHLEFGSGWMLPAAVIGDVMILAGDIVTLREGVDSPDAT